MKYKPTTKKELQELVFNPNIYLGDIDVSLIADMSGLFAGDDKDINRDYSGIETWDTSNVIDMGWIFRSNYYFNHCINDWNVSNVVDMSCAFIRATAFNQPLDKWDISNVRNMQNMFDKAESFNQDLSSWEVTAFMGDNFSFSRGATKFLKKYHPKIIKELTFKEMRKFLEEKGL